jgi:hypothetical protein
MAARLNPSHDERTRAKIQTSQLINRLTQYVNGEVKLEAAQVSAALGLLKKTLPDLSAVDHSGEVTAPFVMRAPMPAETAEAWEKDHSPTIN